MFKLIITSLIAFNIFASPILNQKQLNRIISKVTEDSHYRSTDGDKETLGVFIHGPIVETRDYKYSVEYMLEVYGEYDDENDIYTPEGINLLVLKLPFCDFQFPNSNDYRFERSGLKVDLKGDAINLHKYTRIFDARENDGICGDDRGPSTDTMRPHIPITDDVYSNFQTLLWKFAREL